MPSPSTSVRNTQARAFRAYLSTVGLSQDDAASLIGMDATRFRQVVSGWRRPSFWLIARMERALLEGEDPDPHAQLARLRTIVFGCADAEYGAAIQTGRRKRLWLTLPKPNDPPVEVR